MKEGEGRKERSRRDYTKREGWEEGWTLGMDIMDNVVGGWGENSTMDSN